MTFQSDFFKSNLCLNNLEWLTWLIMREWRAIYEFKIVKIKLIIQTLTKSAYYHSAPILRRKICERSKPVQFLVVWTEMMSTELFKKVELDPVKCLLYPHHTHKHTVHCGHIALDSYEDVRGFCLWLNHPECSASCCTVGSSNCVFVSNGWSVLCGDEIQLLQTPSDPAATLSKSVLSGQAWPPPSFHCLRLKHTS